MLHVDLPVDTSHIGIIT